MTSLLKVYLVRVRFDMTVAVVLVLVSLCTLVVALRLALVDGLVLVDVFCAVEDDMRDGDTSGDDDVDGGG